MSCRPGPAGADEPPANRRLPRLGRGMRFGMEAEVIDFETAAIRRGARHG